MSTPARKMLGPGEEEPRWRLWRVSVEATSAGEALVWAPSYEAALEDARELTDDIIDGSPYDHDIGAYEITDPGYRPKHHEMVWTGGEKGEWVLGDKWKPPEPEVLERLEEVERLRPGPGQLNLLREDEDR